MAKRQTEHIEEHIEECLACLAFPKSHRRRIRTANGLERFNEEIKRRSKVVGSSPTGSRARGWLRLGGPDLRGVANR